MSAPRRCLGCGTLTRNGPRCPDCTTQQRVKYHGGWPAHARIRIAEHVASVGYWCPGWAHPAHPAHDLTLDHDELVLCRACNTRKKNLGDG